MKRPHINLTTKLAAALLTIVRPDEHGELRRVISHADAQNMTAVQIISVFVWDHDPIRHEAGGPALPWNLTPRPIIEHRRKSAKIDAPAIAKGKRLRTEQEAFRRRLLEKSGQIPVDVRGSRDDGHERKPPKRAWPSRPFPKKPKRNAR
jgi:hypothetical protein